MTKTYTIGGRRGASPDPSILDALNDTQREAADHTDGPLLILAGAGSGKTRVITHRIAHLIKNEGVLPDHILAVTFTNKAAGEMRERVDALLGDDDLAWRVTISTFHSLGARLLRRHADRLGLDRAFVIYDQDDQTAFIKKLLKDLNRNAGRAEVRHLAEYVDRMKNEGLTPTQAHEAAHSKPEEENAFLYEDYQRGLVNANAVDFGDLILGPLVLFRDNPELAARYSETWRYVMVDEFQDTNPAQYQLLRHLTVAHDNLCVVGDDDQSIYRWRGATVANILDFDTEFPNTKIVKLEQNYRSTETILEAANDVISHNEGRHPKRLWTENAGGDPIVCFAAQDDREEAEWVARKIDQLHREGLGYREMAVFYRTNAQSRSFEEKLRFQGIPYQLVGGTSFYARAEIKDILAYLRVALNPHSAIDLLRVVNTPTRGVGAGTIDKLTVAAALPQMGSLWNVIHWLHRDEVETTKEHPPGWLPGIDAALPVDQGLETLQSLPGRTARGLEAFHSIVTRLRRRLEEGPLLAPIVQELIEKLDYRSYLERTEAERVEDKMRNVDELVNAIHDFERQGGVEDSPAATLREFLDRSALIAQTDDIDPTLGAVTLMTVHSSKGLEFDTVFLAGMENEIFPGTRDEDPHELEEERRLAYVAITRARRQLYVSLALRRRLYGEYRDMTPSCFLEDIDPQRITVDAASATIRAARSPRRTPRGRSTFGRGTAEWEFDQSPPMVKGSVKRAAERLRSTPHVDEYSQLPAYEVWDAPASTDFERERGEDDYVGATCSHTSFGVGTVLAVSGVGDLATITVEFADGTQKKIKRKWLKIFA